MNKKELIQKNDGMLQNQEMMGQARHAVHILTNAYILDKEEMDLEPAAPSDILWESGQDKKSLKNLKVHENWIQDLDLNKEHLQILNDSSKEIVSPIINASMKLLRKSSEDFPGFLNTECIASLNYAIESELFLQIIHCRKQNHWIVVRACEGSKNSAFIYDSMYYKPIGSVAEQVSSLLRPKNDKFSINYQWCPLQNDGVACGLHAIANLTELLLSPDSFEKENWTWNIDQMRKHLIYCFEKGKIISFPKLNTNTPGHPQDRKI